MALPSIWPEAHYSTFFSHNAPPPHHTHTHTYTHTHTHRMSRLNTSVPTSGNDADVLHYFRLQTTESTLLDKRGGAAVCRMKSSRLVLLFAFSSFRSCSLFLPPGCGLLCLNELARGRRQDADGHTKGKSRKWVLKKPREKLLSFSFEKRWSFLSCREAVTAPAMTPDITLISSFWALFILLLLALFPFHPMPWV